MRGGGGEAGFFGAPTKDVVEHFENVPVMDLSPVTLISLKTFSSLNRLCSRV